MSMTEAEWLTQTYHAQRMVWELRNIGKVTRTKAGKRQLRLLACGCCRIVWELLTDPRLREGVEVAERFAEANASKEELQAAYDNIWGLTASTSNYGKGDVRKTVAADMAIHATHKNAYASAFYMTATIMPLAGCSAGGKQGEPILCDLVRCVFGNPFCPVCVDPSWHTWNHGTIPRLAETIYRNRSFEDLPILADALEDAGCTEAQILEHCRQQSIHVRGCHVVDLLMENQ